MHGEGFSWFSFLPGYNPELIHVYGAILVAVLLIVTTWIARTSLLRAMSKEDGALVPDHKLTYRNFFELCAEGLYKLTESTLGEHEAPRFFPIIGCLFIFIFVSNLLGLIPGLMPPTDNLNTTLALGLFVFVYYNYVGVKEHGVGYLKHFMGPVIGLAPLMFVIELVSHLVRPLALGLRLRGNIYGDHLVLGLFSSLIPVGVPIIFYAFGIFVSFVQAFVFCLLTMVYISLSTAHDH
jgi:F-type H+-transporting ATPase subunit a